MRLGLRLSSTAWLEGFTKRFPLLTFLPPLLTLGADGGLEKLSYVRLNSYAIVEIS